MDILALDMATITGWATHIDGNTESGVQDFTKRRGESNGMIYLRFNAWLDKMTLFSPCTVEGRRRLDVLCADPDNILPPFDLVVYEQAHHRGGAATEIGVGLMTRAQEFATRIGAEYTAVHTSTLKKFATGSGRASKEDIMTWASFKTGRAITDDNEADALALLYYAREEYNASV